MGNKSNLGSVTVRVCATFAMTLEEVMKLDAGIVDDLKRQKPNIAVLVRVRYRATPPPAPPRRPEGSNAPVPPSLLGKPERR